MFPLFYKIEYLDFLRLETNYQFSIIQNFWFCSRRFSQSRDVSLRCKNFMWNGLLITPSSKWTHFLYPWRIGDWTCTTLNWLASLSTTSHVFWTILMITYLGRRLIWQKAYLMYDFSNLCNGGLRGTLDSFSE